MACIGVSWGVFVVWTPKQLYTETIHFDEKEWENSLVKLDLFWHNAYAPELVDGRIHKGGAVRSWKFQDGDVWRDAP